MVEEWSSPKYDEYGMTQWSWRVIDRENFKLGNHVSVGCFTIIDAKNSVIIEDNVQIGWSCTIISNSSIDGREGKVTLKEGCKIGANSVIFPNITIGKNSIVGANSLVNHNIPDNEIWFGTPAKFYKSI